MKNQYQQIYELIFIFSLIRSLMRSLNNKFNINQIHSSNQNMSYFGLSFDASNTTKNYQQTKDSYNKDDHSVHHSYSNSSMILGNAVQLQGTFHGPVTIINSGNDISFYEKLMGLDKAITLVRQKWKQGGCQENATAEEILLLANKAAQQIVKELQTQRTINLQEKERIRSVCCEMICLFGSSAKEAWHFFSKKKFVEILLKADSQRQGVELLKKQFPEVDLCQLI